MTKDNKNPDPATVVNPPAVPPNDPPPVAPAPAGFDLAGDAASQLERMPEPSEGALEAEKTKSGTTDSSGVTFDPLIHGAGKDGAPLLTKSGTFRKKSGRGSAAFKSSVVSAPPPGAPSPAPAPVAPGLVTDDLRARCRPAAIAATALTLQLGVSLGGDEWLPRVEKKTGQDERAEMEFCFTEYLASRGITDFPPGVALAVCLCAYAGPRFIMPKTRTRVQTTWEKISIWWQARKLKKRLNATQGPAPVPAPGAKIDAHA